MNTYTTISTSSIVGQVRDDGAGVYSIEYYAIDTPTRNLALYNLRNAVAWAAFSAAAGGKISIEISDVTETTVEIYADLELRRLEIVARIEAL